MQSISKKYRLPDWLRLVGLASLIVLFGQAQLISHTSSEVQAQRQNAIQSKRNGNIATTADTYETTASTERSGNVAAY